MEDIKEREKIKLSVFCPYLKREVILYKNTWHYKILNDHPEVSNRIELITAILSKDEKRAVITTVHGQRNLPRTDMEEIK